MADPVFDKIVVQLLLDSKQYTKGLKDAQIEAAKFERKTRRTTTGLRQLDNVIVGVARKIGGLSLAIKAAKSLGTLAAGAGGLIATAAVATVGLAINKIRELREERRKAEEERKRQAKEEEKRLTDRRKERIENILKAGGRAKDAVAIVGASQAEVAKVRDIQVQINQLRQQDRRDTEKFIRKRNAAARERLRLAEQRTRDREIREKFARQRVQAPLDTAKKGTDLLNQTIEARKKELAALTQGKDKGRASIIDKEIDKIKKKLALEVEAANTIGRDDHRLVGKLEAQQKELEIIRKKIEAQKIENKAKKDAEKASKKAATEAERIRIKQEADAKAIIDSQLTDSERLQKKIAGIIKLRRVGAFKTDAQANKAIAGAESEFLENAPVAKTVAGTRAGTVESFRARAASKAEAEARKARQDQLRELRKQTIALENIDNNGGANQLAPANF